MESLWIIHTLVVMLIIVVNFLMTVVISIKIGDKEWYTVSFLIFVEIGVILMSMFLLINLYNVVK